MNTVLVNWEVLILWAKHMKKYVSIQLSSSILSVLLSFIRLKFSTKLISKLKKKVCCPFGVRTVYMVVQNDRYIFDSLCVLLKGVWSTLVPWGHHTQKSEFKECWTTHQLSTSRCIRVQRFQIRYFILFLQSPLSAFFCNGAHSPRIATHCVCIYVCTCVCVCVCKILHLAAIAKESEKAMVPHSSTLANQCFLTLCIHLHVKVFQPCIIDRFTSQLMMLQQTFPKSQWFTKTNIYLLLTFMKALISCRSVDLDLALCVFTF